MTPMELCEKLGGYANMNKLVVTHNGKAQYLARMDKEGEYQFTDLGKTLVAEANAKAAVGLGAEPDDKPKRKRRTKAEIEADAGEKIEMSFDDT